MPSLRVASLFTGIGGFDVGLERAGHRVVLQVEKDPRCRRVLARRFPDVALVHDVAEVLPHALDGVDLLVAGFPCNDCSFENPTRPGLRYGHSTQLVRHVFRLLAERRVPWVLLENVVGLLRWHFRGEEDQPPAIEYIVSEFERLGYRWAYRVVDLLAFGVPHKRRRVFIVASVHGDPRDVVLSQDTDCRGACETYVARAREVSGRSNERTQCYDCFNASRDDDDTFGTRIRTACVDLGETRRAPLLDICQCLTTSNGRRTCVIAREHADATPSMRALAIEDAERLMGFEPGHTAPCARASSVDDAGFTSHATHAVSARFSLLGAACAVQHSEWLGERLRAPYATKFLHHAASTPFETPCAVDARRDGVQSDVHRRQRTVRTSWPLAAYNVFDSLDDDDDDVSARRAARRRAPSTLSESPILLAFVPLGEFLTHTHVRDEVDRETRVAYRKRLRESGHDDVDDLVRVALDDDPRGRGVDSRRDDENTQCSSESDASNHRRAVEWSMRKVASCGACARCRRSDKATSRAPSRTRPRGPRDENSTADASSTCVRVRVIAPLARAGHVGAALAMTGRRAVGRRVRVFWELDDAFFSVTLAAFYARAYAYRIEYDDGDVETSFEPWREVVSLVK